MGNRIIIQFIRIKNFRSIRNSTINVSGMNIFVGLNDAGKSNVLKALNLFFNNSTDYDMKFDFEKDFSYLFPKTSHSTKEISIELKVEIPDSYQNSGTYTWKKAWRRDGETQEKILDENGKEPSGRSRIPYTLHKIKFRYVPAVKSKEFYKYLLSELYLTAAASLNSPLVDSTKEFAGVIQNYTEQIHEEVSARIGIESKLTIPSDMTDMFRTLIFMTNGKDEDISIPLEMRGDGIQSRHIPIIMKYLAEEDQKTRNQGSAKITSIWGYEEPENGIELLKTFDLAESFREYSQEIQLFITTHSPAFYQQDNHEGSKVFYVKKNESNETIINDSIDIREIGNSMGLMPLVAPYIAEMQQKLNELINRKDDDLLVDVPTVFVEGITDKRYIELAARLFSPDLQTMLESGNLRIFTKAGQGGCTEIYNWVHAWIYKKNKSKTLAIFDKDSAGIIAHNELASSAVFKQSQNNKIEFIPPNESIKVVLRKKIKIQFEIEHLLSSQCWKRLIATGIATERSASTLNEMLGGHADINKATKELYQELIPDENIRETIVYYEPEKDSKDKIFTLVNNCCEEEQREYLSGFHDLITLLEKRFVIKNNEVGS